MGSDLAPFELTAVSARNRLSHLEAIKLPAEIGLLKRKPSLVDQLLGRRFRGSCRLGDLGVLKTGEFPHDQSCPLPFRQVIEIVDQLAKTFAVDRDPMRIAPA